MCAAVVLSSPLSFAEVERPPEARVREIAAMLGPDPCGFGPPIADRAAWKRFAQRESSQAWMARAEKLLTGPLPEQPDALFLEYTENGNRSRWERVANQRRGRIAPFVLAECMENAGRFLPALEEVIHALCAERTWVMSAHDPKLENFHGKATHIDLGSSHLSANLALADYLLGDRLQPQTRALLRENVRRRTLDPFLATLDGNRPPDRWLKWTNNWNSVCLAEVTQAALALVESRDERALFIAAAELYSRYFLQGFTPDGYCSEGLSYWNYGFGHYVLLVEAIHQATGGALDLLAVEGVKEPAQFGARLEIFNGLYPAFADCPIATRPDPAAMYYVSRRLGLGLEQWERKEPGSSRSSLPIVLLYGFPNSASRSAPAPEASSGPGPRTWFADAGVLIARPGAASSAKMGVALKGGHNAEHHNHNDVGSYVVAVGKEIVLAELGAEVYTARTFGSGRYDSKALNSFGHPVPVVAGQLQRTGAEAQGRVLRTDFTEQSDTLVLDLTSAYDVPQLEKLHRAFEYSRQGDGHLKIVDEVVFRGPERFADALITFGHCERIAPDEVLILGKKAAVRVRIAVEGSPFEIRPEAIHENLRVPDQPTRVGIELTQPVEKARVTMLIAPASARLKSDAPPGGSFSVVTPGGAWCWFADPRAVWHDGRTYIGWLSTDGSVQVGCINPAGRTPRVATLHEKLQRDDHDNPSLLFLPDGKLMAFYSRHGGDEMLARVCSNPKALEPWSEERALPIHTGPRPNKSVTYPNPVLLTEEDNTIYLFWRGDNFKPNWARSRDNGESWEPLGTVLSRKENTQGNRPYVKIATDGRKKIHLIFTDGHPRNEPLNSVYYACYHDGAFHRADGSQIAALADLPFEPSQADKVYDAAAHGNARAWVWDLALDANGRPILVYAACPTEEDHRYRYAAWDGSRWIDNEITWAGPWFPQTPKGEREREPHYSGGVVLDHTQPSVVYLSRRRNDRFEIERWTTADLGRTWRSEHITGNSARHNIRPFVARNHPADASGLFWMNGDYRHYTDFRTAIMMHQTRPSSARDPEAIEALMRQVADWQLTQELPVSKTDWINGAFYAGAMALGHHTGDRRYYEAMKAIGEENEWKIGPRTFFADDYCVGQTYSELYEIYKSPEMIANWQDVADQIAARPHTESLEWKNNIHLREWAWCDALFMGPPSLAYLYAVTGDRKYLDTMNEQWWHTTDYLFDAEESLYWRDSSFFGRRAANGKKVFWSRGNGWVMAGLVRVLSKMPEDYPDRPRYVELFTKMAARIVKLQTPDGTWHPSLLDPDDPAVKETSGTGFFCYALAWGVNQGILDRETYTPVVRSAWDALAASVHPDGKLGFVQVPAAAPGATSFDSSMPYGVGAFLLAGTEVAKLAGGEPRGHGRDAAAP